MESTSDKKVVYEWVVTISNGDEFYLTENQYNYLIENMDERFVNLDRQMINPAFVQSAIKRPANVIKGYYPCLTCHSSGYEMKDGKQSICSKCGGSGVDL